jgi:hypothetical protein
VSAPEARQTRRDVSWAVLFRLARTNVWVEWSSGHRSSAEAIRDAEVLVPVTSVAEIRFDRITHQRDRFDLHGIAQLDDKETP